MKFKEMQKRLAVTLFGLALAAGTLATGTASASAATTQTAARAPSAYRCHWVRGHWRYDYRRGHRYWVPRHRVCYR